MTTEEAPSSPTILVVDDERSIADLYTQWLADRYTVRTAYSGNDGLSQFDAAVDIVLLDRRMPDLSGDQVLDVIRSSGVEVRVAMVTAVDPDFDVIEMGFDDYIVKPVERTELIELIKQLRSVDSYSDLMQEYYQLASKKATLEASKTNAELRQSEEYAQLLADLKAVQQQVDAVPRDQPANAFRELV